MSAEQPHRRETHRSDRLRVRVLVAIALVAAVAVGLDTTTPSRAAGQRAVRLTTEPAVVSGSDAVSSAWYCAEGTSVAGGRADESVVIANVGGHALRADVTVMSASAKPVQRSFTVAARAQAAVRVADLLAVPDPGVLVEVFGGPAAVEHVVGGNGDLGVGPCATSASRTWHFAAGTTAKGAEQWLSLFNPFGDDAVLDISFLTDQGLREPEALKGFVVPRRTKVEIPVHEKLPRVDAVATEIRARRGRVVAEESLVLDGTDGRKGLTLSLGALAPQSSWVFPSGGGTRVREVLALSNPGTNAATVRVDTVLDGIATLQPQQVVVPPGSLVQTDLDARVPAGTGFWVSLHATGAPVVAEQFTAAGGLALADTIGVWTPERRWVLAVGRLATTSTDALIVANPGSRTATFDLRAIGGGRVLRPLGTRRVRVGPHKRVVLTLGRLGVPAGPAVAVDADRPVVVERWATGGPGGLTFSPAIPDLG